MTTMMRRCNAEMHARKGEFKRETIDLTFVFT